MYGIKQNIQNYKIVFVIGFILFIIPFFWLKPGEMDLGGDSTRLYFYDPQSYLLNVVLYPILGNSTGEIQYGVYSFLPYVFILLVLKKFFVSSTLLIILSNSLKLSVGFIAMYAILKEMLPKPADDPKQLKIIEISSILGGLFYIFSRYMIDNYNMALLYHNQVFLNPLMFYLLMKYFITLKKQYVWSLLLLSFIFAPSFSLISAPAFFSFYPIALIFLFIYIKFIRKLKIQFGHVLITIVMFIGLNAFYVVPQVYDIFSSSSPIHAIVFNQQHTTVRTHFYGILGIVQPVINILQPSSRKEFEIISLILPLILVMGFYFNRQKNKIMPLTAIFFLLIYFLLSAKVIWVGQELYSYFFYIPGFTLFRNFNGVFIYVYSFFYAFLFGQAVYFIFIKLSPFRVRLFSVVISAVIVSSSWLLINGELVNKTLSQSNNVKSFMIMDPKYEETLNFLRNNPSNGRILTLPFTDSSHEVVHGLNNGAYVGASPIAFLAGKNDFSGYPMIAPYSQSFWELSKEKDFDSIKKLLGLLNVQYVFYNNDPNVYDNTFPDYPYSPIYVRKYMPQNQKEYKEYVNNLATKKIFQKGTYNFYQLDEKFFLPRFYIPHETSFYKNNPNLSIFDKSKGFLSKQNNSDQVRTIYADYQICGNAFLHEVCNNKIIKNIPEITFEKINNIRYKVNVSGVKEPYVLVFLDQYHKDWDLIDQNKENTSFYSRIQRIFSEIIRRIVSVVIKEQSQDKKMIASYFNGDIKEIAGKNIFLSQSTFSSWGKTAIADNRHFQVNGYANAWYILPSDMQNRGNYELTVELSGQKIFFLSLVISCISFAGLIFWGIIIFFVKNKK